MVLLYDRTFVAGSFRAAWRDRRGLHLALAATWLFLGWLVLGSGDRGGSFDLGDPRVLVALRSYAIRRGDSATCGWRCGRIRWCSITAR